MKIHLQTFGSAFARRLFLFLFLAIATPTLVLALVIFNQVSSHLSTQHRQQMHEDAKHVGMALFDRLQRISLELPRLAASQGKSHDASPVIIQPPDFPPPWLHPDALPSRGLPEQVSAADASLLISQLRDEQGLALLVATLQRGDGSTVVARLDPDFLWTPEQYAADRSVCVFQDSRHVLFCSEIEVKVLNSVLASARDGSASGQFVWSGDQGAMRSVYWDLFLLNIGIEPGWTIVVSEPQTDLFAPIGQFGLTLVAVVLLAILAALMFGIGHLRRVLRPLQILRAAARRVGEGDRGSQVAIHSGDEFEELADTFNTMSTQLDRQFYHLEALTEIDRLILSSVNANEIIAPVLALVRRLLDCECIAVAYESDGAARLIYSVRADGAEKERCDTFVLPLADYRRATQEVPDDAGPSADVPPDWLAATVPVPECSQWRTVPMMVADRLEGLLVFGSEQGEVKTGEKLGLASQAVGRISVALSRARWQAELYRQARFDELTGLPNRLALKESLAGVIQYSRSSGLRLVVLFLDLDRFKLINDSIGHAAGDRYLQEVAWRVQRSVRSGDLVARLGGDEFMVAMLELGDDIDLTAEVRGVVDKLLASIPQPVRLGLHELRSTLSVGISIFPDDGETLEDLMKQADTAMYQAKRSGGNSYRFYASSMQMAARQRMELESDMRHAIETDQFELFFQPQVAANNLRVEGAEVLLRWNHPTRGMVAPDLFIPIAEESMLITEIDRWVLNAACRQIRAWLDAGTQPLRLAINISAAQFQRDTFVDLVTSTLSGYDLKPDHIELEITEGALIQDADRALEVLNTLRGLGIRLALDDFGTGYCSLSYLKTMPIHKLKIDRSFIQDITRSASDAAVVDAILHLASKMDLRTIAEGVETREEQAWLAGRGCDAYQGYLFYRPLKLDAFNQLLAELQVSAS